MLSLYREDRRQPNDRGCMKTCDAGECLPSSTNPPKGYHSCRGQSGFAATDFLVQGALQRIELRILPRLTKQLSVGAAFYNLAALHE